jgi:hypothetical protein
MAWQLCSVNPEDKSSNHQDGGKWGIAPHPGIAPPIDMKRYIGVNDTKALTDRPVGR